MKLCSLSGFSLDLFEDKGGKGWSTCMACTVYTVKVPCPSVKENHGFTCWQTKKRDRKGQVKTCFSTLFTLTFCLFAVSKGGDWQTVLQHGEGRPESPQQRGRGGDGMPIFILHQ